MGKCRGMRQAKTADDYHKCVCVCMHRHALTCVLMSHFSEALSEPSNWNGSTWFCLPITQCYFVVASIVCSLSLPCLCICCLGCAHTHTCTHKHTLLCLADFLLDSSYAALPGGLPWPSSMSRSHKPLSTTLLWIWFLFDNCLFAGRFCIRLRAPWGRRCSLLCIPYHLLSQHFLST